MSNVVPLDQRLRFIGFRISYHVKDVTLGGTELFQCDIEKTLIDAAYEAIEDGRIRSLLFSWIKVHGERVNVEKFFKLSEKAQEKMGHNPIINGIAVFASTLGLNRYKKYVERSKKNEYLIGQDETESFAKIV